jgi:hypothetical protein
MPFKAPNLGDNRIYKKGRSTVGWTKGERITRLDQLKPGDLLISVSHQFQAENLVRVVVNPSPIPSVFYCEYVTPDTLRRSDHEEMAIRDFELAGSDRKDFFRAVRTCRAIIV